MLTAFKGQQKSMKRPTDMYANTSPLARTTLADLQAGWFFFLSSAGVVFHGKAFLLFSDVFQLVVANPD